MRPLFSVLIANYNNAHYIEEAIQSVFSQSYENWEIIIIDDASTDNSMEILSKYKNDSRIHIFTNEQNYGCGYTKRKCVELASGTIAGFLDPDDLLKNTALHEMVEAHSNNPEASLIYSNLFHCDENLNNCKPSSYIRQVPEGLTYLEMSAGMVSQFATFKIKYYLQTFGIDPIFKRAVDQDLYLKLEEVGQLIYLNTELYYYRINIGGISSFENKNKAFSWNILARINACQRRGINIEEIIGPLVNSEESIRQFYENSNDYKIGSWILAPYRWIKYNQFKRFK
jgi:glycosyltransferase involved in cell wall biosynthesis